jgi:hypothetical protein
MQRLPQYVAELHLSQVMDAQRPHTWHTELPPPTAIGTLAEILREYGMLLLELVVEPLESVAGCAVCGLAAGCGRVNCMSGGSWEVLSVSLFRNANHPRLFFLGG